MVDTYHNIRIGLGEGLDTLHARRFGTEGEGGKANRVQEGRGLVNQDAVDSLHNRGTQHGLVDKPELGHEVVDPFSRLGLIFDLWCNVFFF